MNAILKLLSSILASLPKKIFYGIANLIAFILQTLLHYRKKTILKNLSIINPNLSEKEIQTILTKFYRNLADLMLESFASGAMSKKRILNMVESEGVHVFDSFKGKRVIVAGAHTANWELAALSMSEEINRPVYGVYKPIKNKTVENFYKKSRAHLGMVPIPMNQAARHLINSEEAELTLGLIADQHSSNLKKSIWISFFGRATCFLPGLEILAKKYAIPVVFANCTRIDKGQYRITYSILSKHPELEKPGAITLKYGAKLEEVIRNEPYNWLLSHKRWKVEKPDETLPFDYT